MQELLYARLLLPAAQRHGDRAVVTDFATGVTHTLSQHIDRVQRVIRGLRQLDVERGDRFAVLALNSSDYLALYHAAFLGGGVINPLNLRFAAAELVHVLRDSGTKVCFVDSTFAPLIDCIRAEAGLDHVVRIGHAGADADVTFDDLVSNSTPLLPGDGHECDPVVLMYTGGTTGGPKGVLLSQRAEMLNIYHSLMATGAGRSDVHLLQTPMFHASSMYSIAVPAAFGGHVVTVPFFDPSVVLRALAQHQPQVTMMVPTMISLLFSHPDFHDDALSTLTDLIYGAAPMPRVLVERLRTRYPTLNLWQGYGMTESSSLVTLLGPDEHRNGDRYLSSAGRAVPGVTISIRDFGGSEVPAGTTGEVCVQGGNFMTSYWDQPAATVEAFEGGWYHTGDAGYLDADGYLYLVDRVKDMIVTGGENVYSIEVENALASHPAVAQVAVIGIPDSKWGEAVHAVVVTRDGSAVTFDELVAHARDSIGAYKLPKSIEFRTEPLPLSAAMKVLKRELRAPYWAGEERRIS
ncbi:MAG: AMP-binding protein [Acidimicrobiales bacterium]